MSEIPQRIYFVALPAPDGMAPDFTECVDRRVYYSLDEAKTAARQLKQSTGEKYRVYLGVIHVPRFQIA